MFLPVSFGAGFVLVAERDERDFRGENTVYTTYTVPGCATSLAQLKVPLRASYRFAVVAHFALSGIDAPIPKLFGCLKGGMEVDVGIRRAFRHLTVIEKYIVATIGELLSEWLGGRRCVGGGKSNGILLVITRLRAVRARHFQRTTTTTRLFSGPC